MIVEALFARRFPAGATGLRGTTLLWSVRAWESLPRFHHHPGFFRASLSAAWMGHVFFKQTAHGLNQYTSAQFHSQWCLFID